jgi:nitroreductase
MQMKESCIFVPSQDLELMILGLTENAWKNSEKYLRSNKMKLAAMPLPEIIRKRSSCRTYDGNPVNEDMRRLLMDFVSGLENPPFGSEARFQIVDLHLKGRGTVPGTYGVIKGAKSFLAGAVKNGPMDLEDFGFQFEKIILYATAIGLETCWMGATFSRALFGKPIELQHDEILPAISPIGYRTQKRSLRDSFFHMTAKSKDRNPWSDQFFRGDFSKPLTEEDAGKLAIPLEMVRIAPSAVNLQPWRLIMDGSRVHFFLRRSRKYRKLFKVDLQRIDMGIAMCHFALAAREQGLEGLWDTRPAKGISIPEDMEYVVSWCESRMR